MKYCCYCGKELLDEAVICPSCGCEVKKRSQMTANKIFKLIAKISAAVSVGYMALIASYVLLIFAASGMFGEGLLWFIPLIWQIPLMLSVFRKIDGNEYMSQTFKICVLIFLCIPTGVMLLLIKDEEISKN